MTQQEFLRQLKRTRRSFHWTLDKRGTLRAYRGFLFIKREYCPLTAVAKKMKGKTFGVIDIVSAADSIGLQKIEPIMKAADNIYFHNSRLRQRMLAAVGLA